MRRISTFGAAVAGLALAISPALLAQQQDTTNTNAGSHVQDPRPETSPSNAQNDPDKNGAQDPARVGTMTSSNQDTNNNRLPASSKQEGTVTQTSSPATTYEQPVTTTTTDTTTTTVDTAPPPAAVSSTTATDTTDTSTPPSTLPRTASHVPLAGLTGLAALGAALAVRSRRLPR